MKAVVFILVLLAAGKVGANEYLHRAATREVIVSAYRDRAVAACAKDTRLQGMIQPAAWQQPVSIQLTIGKPSLDVYIWQTDHRLWAPRFTNPYLQVEAAQPTTRVLCEYDIVHGTASLVRL